MGPGIGGREEGGAGLGLGRGRWDWAGRVFLLPHQGQALFPPRRASARAPDLTWLPGSAARSSSRAEKGGPGGSRLESRWSVGGVTEWRRRVARGLGDGARVGEGINICASGRME